MLCSKCDANIQEENTDEVKYLRRKVKNLQRDLKTANYRIAKLKVQKRKLLQKLNAKKYPSIKNKRSSFFNKEKV